MGMIRLEQGNVYLDVNVFIYLLEGYAEFTSVLSQLIDHIDSGNLQAFTSELSLAEALVKPISNKNLPLQNLYESTIQTTSNLCVCSVDREILIQAAKLRAKSLTMGSSVRLPDAIHLATAEAYQCNYFITNDAALKNYPTNVKVLLLSEIKTSNFILV